MTGVFPQGETIVCEAPITQVSHKLGYVCAWEVAGMQSKEAKTEFVAVSTDGVTSVVRCFPKTGQFVDVVVYIVLVLSISLNCE